MNNASWPVPPCRFDEWRKSSFSNAQANCVEVKFTADGIVVRDSKDKREDQPMINVSPAAWISLLKNIE